MLTLKFMCADASQRIISHDDYSVVNIGQDKQVTVKGEVFTTSHNAGDSCTVFNVCYVMNIEGKTIDTIRGR